MSYNRTRFNRQSFIVSLDEDGSAPAASAAAGASAKWT